jgi:hypothetical protein
VKCPLGWLGGPRGSLPRPIPIRYGLLEKTDHRSVVPQPVAAHGGRAVAMGLGL